LFVLRQPLANISGIGIQRLSSVKCASETEEGYVVWFADVERLLRLFRVEAEIRVKRQVHV
jgi:hypothetical protein